MAEKEILQYRRDGGVNKAAIVLFFLVGAVAVAQPDLEIEEGFSNSTQPEYNNFQQSSDDEDELEPDDASESAAFDADDIADDGKKSDDSNSQTLKSDVESEIKKASGVIVDASDSVEDGSALVESSPGSADTSTKRLQEELRPANRQRVKKIPHPLAKKGLYRITKDNVYYYQVKKSPQSRAMTVSFGNYGPDNFKGGETYFTSIYESSLMLTIDYEWQFWNRFGTLGFVVGSGLFFSQGNGVFENGTNAGQSAREKFYFLMFPNNGSLVYRAKYTDDQVVVPFAEGGLGYYVFAEKREDNLDKWHGRWGGALAGQYGLGLSFNLNSLSESGLISLDREYGINNLYVNLAYKGIVGFHSDFDVSANIINVGFTGEF